MLYTSRLRLYFRRSTIPTHVARDMWFDSHVLRALHVLRNLAQYNGTIQWYTTFGLPYKWTMVQHNDTLLLVCPRNGQWYNTMIRYYWFALQMVQHYCWYNDTLAHLSWVEGGTTKCFGMSMGDLKWVTRVFEQYLFRVTRPF